MNRLANKKIVITGASSGIGEKVAFKVAELGARPILLARSKDKLKAISDKINKDANINSTYYPLDVGDFAEVNVVFKRITEEIGQVDILLNNAGFGIFDSFHEASLGDIERMFHVNVLGMMACTKAVLPSMINENGGHIINVASQAGKLATPKSSGYAATKHAVLGFTNTLRLELSDTNIFVSSVNPGPIETSFFDIADKSGNYVKNVKRYLLKPDHVAEQIVRLMQNPKRELNLPRWMNTGSVLYNLLPSISDKVVGRFLNKK
ncbi:SDR family NAD(P)-dependent oxidoreductase [Oceanobacillus bengalensis]|uniref:SDR family oxidoreductase n=1 Tax=Oceanobacillus bengalensis TaxID=1435466 RepID=A0A494Z4B9_9BACI|nr:SDR family oxidoreductase [Oceanobacillus bengalensis]RKQ17153.1 SDR family oxidoreductase [Oceanobacillus bengalensis]